MKKEEAEIEEKVKEKETKKEKKAENEDTSKVEQVSGEKILDKKNVES